MKKSRCVKKLSKSKKDSGHLSRVALTVLLGVAAAIATAVISLGGPGLSNGVSASIDPTRSQVTQKRYKPTRDYVVDRQTGQRRMPTKQEISEVVEDLATLSNRSTEGLRQISLANQGVAVDLAGGFGGVVLARPKDDGTWETKCVFTVEEGAEFLGLAEDHSPDKEVEHK